MADTPVVHIGENSPEHVAYRLFEFVCSADKPQRFSREWILDTYAECLLAVRLPNDRLKGEKGPSAQRRAV
jgi:hypothetical protein